VDDEEAVRASLRALLGTYANRVVLMFASAEAFLESIAERESGVLLLDLHMPGMNGVELLERMAPWRERFPTVMVTGRADVPLAVKAMRLGAIDFLEKPYDHHALFDAVDRGFAALEHNAAANAVAERARARVATLSPRELQVMEMLISGATNRQMAEALELSVRTIEVHRANLMHKLEAPNLSAVINTGRAAGMSAMALG
jgi:two-component system response regulator FixJ